MFRKLCSGEAICNECDSGRYKELCGANERFPLFASPHEAIAVIAEEMDEAADEMANVYHLWQAAWKFVKSDSSEALDSITKMKFAAECLAIEACQVAAMCEKAVQSAAKWDEGKMQRD